MTGGRSVLCIALACFPALAQEAGGGRLLRDLLPRQKHIWTTPFRLDKRQWLTKALPIAAGTAALMAADKHITHEMTESPRGSIWSGRVSQAGACYTLAGLTALTMAAGAASRRPAVRSAGEDAALAFADASILTMGLKFASGRERPAQSGRGGFLKGKDSFPSGHAMTSWAVATAIARRRGTPRWLAITSYSAAAAISVSRIGANRHWATDVFMGGILGALIGDHAARGRR